MWVNPTALGIINIIITCCYIKSVCGGQATTQSIPGSSGQALTCCGALLAGR